MNGNTAIAADGQPLLPSTTQSWTPHRMDRTAQKIWDLTECEPCQDVWVGPRHINPGHQVYKVPMVLKGLRALGSELAR